MKDINYLPSAGHLPNRIDAFDPLLNEPFFASVFLTSCFVQQRTSQ